MNELPESNVRHAWRGKHLVVTLEMYVKLRQAFDHVNCFQQIEIADAWLDANPRRRPRNQYRFLVNWFQKQPRPAKEVNVGSGPSDLGINIKVKPEAVERSKR